jgi:Fur family ferric uptake transcriptional regulator
MIKHCSGWVLSDLFSGRAGQPPLSRKVSREIPMSNIDELKNTGLKATLPRLKILEIFQAGKQRHMTAEDVFRVLLEERSDIGLATVYRVLMQFEQAGLLNRSNFESGKAVYEINEGQHHDHLVCLDCGRVEEFYVDLRQLHQARLPQSVSIPRAAPSQLNFQENLGHLSRFRNIHMPKQLSI